MITTIQFKTLDDLYDFYNKNLFGGKLPDCIVNISRHAGSYGFFAARRWRVEEKGKERVAHEINLNPDYLDRPFEEWHAMLVHEMVHLWQEDFGHPSRAAYHNREWAGMMEELGLVPSVTGKPGGKKTGQTVTHYIDGKGMFIRVFKSLSAGSLKEPRLTYLPACRSPEPAGKKGREKDRDGEGNGGLDWKDKNKGEAAEKYTSKKKYACPCGNNAWGRPGLKLICGDCMEPFAES